MNRLAVIHWELNVNIVVAPDADTVFVAHNADVLGLSRHLDGIGERLETSQDLRVSARGGKVRLVAHGILQPVIHKRVFARHLRDVKQSGNDQQLEKTSEPAGAEAATTRSHHCDCAPCMSSVTILSI